MSRDLDLFCDTREEVRDTLRWATELAKAGGGDFRLVRDGGTFVRASLQLSEHVLEVDIAHDPSQPIRPSARVDGVLVDSLEDLQANKITCLLSRCEPRDLVDLLFLERAGYSTEGGLPAALQKDAGIDPGVLAFLLTTFPTSPLPIMLVGLSGEELGSFRDALAARLRAVGLPDHRAVGRMDVDDVK